MGRQRQAGAGFGRLSAVHQRLMSQRWYQMLVIAAMYAIHGTVMQWLIG